MVSIYVKTLRERLEGFESEMAVLDIYKLEHSHTVTAFLRVEDTLIWQTKFPVIGDIVEPSFRARSVRPVSCIMADLGQCSPHDSVYFDFFWTDRDYTYTIFGDTDFAEIVLIETSVTY